MINLCERAKQGIPSYGIYISTLDPAVIEMAKLSGFDFARLDGEHIKFDSAILREMFRTARLLDFPLQIRLSSFSDLSTILAMEPSAVMLPHVETEEDARHLVEECKFYPLGQRGMFAHTNAIRYGGIGAQEYLTYANENMHTIVQIESVKGLENLEAIAAMDGVDMLSSGKADLSQSMGIPRQTKDPRVIEAENKIVETALRHGKTPILFANTPERIRELREMGVQCFLVAFDDVLCLNAMKECVKAFRE